MTQDGEKAVSASDDNTLKVWEIKSGQVIAYFFGDYPLLSAAVAPDGLTFVAGGASGTVHILRQEISTG